MADTTKTKIAGLIILLVLGVYAFGQLPGILASHVFSIGWRAHPMDVLLVVSVAVVAIGKTPIPNWFARFVPFFYISIFSLLLAYIFYPDMGSLPALYLLRLFSAFTFSLLVQEFAAQSAKRAILLYKALVLCGCAVAIFGWAQYFLLPDLTSMKAFGWDDHYFRIVSTLLDPAFTAIVLVLTAVLSWFVYKKTSNPLYLLLILAFLLTLGFTYSRAGYLALAAASLFAFWGRLAVKKVALVAALAALAIALLPTYPGGEGVNLLRTASLIQKMENYEISFTLASNSPLFGVGYNNVCGAKAKLGVSTSKQENSCHGLDNSLLFLFVTSGVAGAIAFLYAGSYLVKLRTATLEQKLLNTSLVAVLVHSMFSNTLFHAWVLVWLAVLVAVSQKDARG